MTKVAEFLLGEQPFPSMPVANAKALWSEYRGSHSQFKAAATPLLTDPASNFKLNKSVAPTYGLALAQATLSGYNVCRFSTPECRAHCVAFSGNGMYPRVIAARVVKTQFLMSDPQSFLALLVAEIDKAVVKHGRINLRLNTFSDIPWERVTPWLFTWFGGEVEFYDYTKDWSRGDAVDGDRLPANYHLTYSASERTTRDDIRWMVASGASVAVVVRVKKSEPMPEHFYAWGTNVPMIDGDKTDDRTLDRAVVVGLRPKGTMRGGKSPMVHDVRSE